MMMMGIHISDEMLETFLPTVVYWVYASMYHISSPYLQKYRLHTKEEEESMNMISRGQVIRGVLIFQAAQVASVLVAFSSKDQTKAAAMPQPTLPVMAMQFIIAMVVMDTWQYFTHRMLHTSFLYKHFHFKHHKLVVPDAFGALYIHPVEGILIDVVGSVLVVIAAGMTPRTTMYFLCFAGIKAVDDHCGFLIPWNPIQRMFANNSASHNIHHHLYGQKFNFGSPFFNWWDRMLGTYLPYTIEERKGGGYEAKIIRKKAN